MMIDERVRVAARWSACTWVRADTARAAGARAAAARSAGRPLRQQLEPRARPSTNCASGLLSVAAATEPRKRGQEGAPAQRARCRRAGRCRRRLARRREVDVQPGGLLGAPAGHLVGDGGADARRRRRCGPPRRPSAVGRGCAGSRRGRRGPSEPTSGSSAMTNSSALARARATAGATSSARAWAARAKASMARSSGPDLVAVDDRHGGEGAGVLAWRRRRAARGSGRSASVRRVRDLLRRRRCAPSARSPRAGSAWRS